MSLLSRPWQRTHRSLVFTLSSIQTPFSDTYSSTITFLCFPSFYCLCVLKWKSEVTRSCPTLRDPLDCSPPGSSVHGIFQARVLEWIAISFSRASSWPRDGTQVSRIAGRCFCHPSHQDQRNWSDEEHYGMIATNIVNLWPSVKYEDF